LLRKLRVCAIITLLKKGTKKMRFIIIPGKRKPRFSRIGNAFDGLNAGKTR